MSLDKDLENLKSKIKNRENTSFPETSGQGKMRHSAGIELIAGIVTAFGVVWGAGHILTISYFWRIMIGTILAIAVNVLMVYRMRDK